MADRIVFRYPEMGKAAEDIRGIANRYSSAANTFVSEFDDAIKEWEGASKDKMKTFIDVPVKEYINDTIPKLLEALAQLLEANAKQMEDADNQISENIPTSLG